MGSLSACADALNNIRTSRLRQCQFSRFGVVPEIELRFHAQPLDIKHNELHNHPRQGRSNSAYCHASSILIALSDFDVAPFITTDEEGI